jgi:hypothetical protein
MVAWSSNLYYKFILEDHSSNLYLRLFTAAFGLECLGLTIKLSPHHFNPVPYMHDKPRNFDL